MIFTKHRFCVLVAAGLLAAPALLAKTYVSIGIGIPAPIIIHKAPPPAAEERVLVSPGGASVWVPGHYVWHHRRWVWIRGSWIVPPRSNLVWVNGVWDAHSQSWIEGHWEEVTAQEIIVENAPPPPAQEVVIVRPSPSHIWIGGFWGWQGGHHVWTAGHWELPPHGCRNWEAPRWEHRAHGYAFVPGRWH